MRRGSVTSASIHCDSFDERSCNSFDEAKPSGDTKLRQRRIRRDRRCCHHCLVCMAAQIACIATIAGTVVLSSERPVLRLQQIIGHPQSWLIDAINPHNARGYELVRVPPSLREPLADFAASAPPGTAYSGTCQQGCTIGADRLEDYIISGPTRFSRVPPQLAAAAERELRPLLERFCACRLQARPKVHGLRTYLPGARLAAHLDWPDAWVVSATLCVHRNASLPAWPVALSGVGIPGGTAEVSVREGEALLYEGSRLWHGRPAPLQGGEFTSLFVGFVPEGYPEQAGLATRGIYAAVRTIKGFVVRWLSTGK